ncbi:MAG TPA: hypothetical protein PKA64_18260, partial [Myxococcota bacterium]|nr:hypothetical protein [Myxococcota bacterium]
ASWRATAAITARRAAAGPFVELDGAALRLPGGRSLTLRAGTPVRLGWWSRNTPFPGQPSPEVPAEGAILHVGEGAEALLLWSEDGVIPAKAVDAPRLPAPQGDGVTLRGEDLIAVWRALAAATR